MIVAPGELRFSNPRGFIVLEGVNGSGKSSLSQALQKRLEAEGGKVCRTFEPGNTPAGQQIRKLLLEQTSAERRLTSTTELLLFSADRNLHVEQVIRPALARKEIVICDRFFYSTMAFQGYGRGAPLEQIETLSQIAVGDLRPDLVILLDLAPEAGLARTGGRKEVDSFEHEALAFHERLRKGFLEIAKSRPEPFLVIDASQRKDQVEEQAWQVLKNLK